MSSNARLRIRDVAAGASGVMRAHDAPGVVRDERTTAGTAPTK